MVGGMTTFTDIEAALPTSNACPAVSLSFAAPACAKPEPYDRATRCAQKAMSAVSSVYQSNTPYPKKALRTNVGQGG